MSVEAVANRRFSSHIKKKSILKLQSEESEAAFNNYQVAVDNGEIIVHSMEQDTAQVSQISTCTSCDESVEGNKMCDYCRSCSRKFHLKCLEILGDKPVCIECMRGAKWDEVDEKK